MPTLAKLIVLDNVDRENKIHVPQHYYITQGHKVTRFPLILIVELDELKEHLGDITKNVEFL